MWRERRKREKGRESENRKGRTAGATVGKGLRESKKWVERSEKGGSWKVRNGVERWEGLEKGKREDG